MNEIENIYQYLWRIYKCAEGKNVKKFYKKTEAKKFASIISPLSKYAKRFIILSALYVISKNCFSNFKKFLEEIVKNIEFRDEEFFRFKRLLKNPKKYIRDLNKEYTKIDNILLFELFFLKKINFLEFYYYYNENEKTIFEAEEIYKRIKCILTFIKFEKNKKLLKKEKNLFKKE